MNAKYLVIVSVLTGLLACGEGVGWQTITPDWSIHWQLPDDRINEDGTLQLASNTKIMIRSFRASLSADLLVGDVVATTAQIDEDNPPAGYSFCHNNHCHRISDNALISYETILAEANLSSDSSQQIAIASDGITTIDQNDVIVETMCTVCEIEDLAVTELQWVWSEIEVVGSAQLPSTTTVVDFAWKSTEPVVARLPISLAYDSAQPVFGLLASWEISPSLLDDVEFSVASSSPSLPTVLLERFIDLYPVIEIKGRDN